jgi:hypothetical protein
MIKLKAESSLEMELLMRSKRVIEELSMDNVFLEFLALQSSRRALYFCRIGFESAFFRRNGRYGFEAIRPVIDLPGRDPMFALAVSVVTVGGQHTLAESRSGAGTHFIIGQTGLLIGSSCLV